MEGSSAALSDFFVCKNVAPAKPVMRSRHVRTMETGIFADVKKDEENSPGFHTSMTTRLNGVSA